jgi:hypothetical protein
MATCGDEACDARRHANNGDDDALASAAWHDAAAVPGAHGRKRFTCENVSRGVISGMEGVRSS